MSLPEAAAETDEKISNYDGAAIAPGIEDQIRAGRVCQHPGWDHHGRIWFADGKFHERVMVHGQHRGTMTCATLPELIRAVNAEFGWR